MKVLVAYATSEGQTRKIARKAADHIVDAGHSAELIELSAAADIDLGRFDGVIVGASIHAGHYQRALAHFVSEKVERLKLRPSLFLSVSLAAAGHDAEDWRALDRILQDFEDATGWTPGRVEQVAGAYLPSKYDIVRRFIMRRIIAAKAPDADLDADKEYTDWQKLDDLVDEWLASVAARAVQPAN